MSQTKNTPLQVYNRYSKQLESEPVYGEAWLRWAYGNPLGRLSVWSLASRRFFSAFYGWRMSRPDTRQRIAGFVQEYGLEEKDFDRPITDYASFNEFFARGLGPGARPVDADPDAVVFPADGRHLAFEDYSKCDGIFIKGERFHLDEMLGNADLYRFFKNGVVVISRLAPIDYHRFHFPLAGTASAPVRRPGALFSVSPIALRRNIHYLSRNMRMITEVRNERIGVYLQIEVGATNVGSIIQTYSPDAEVDKGEEKGYFQFGGSTVISIFPPESVQLAEDLRQQTERRTELYARMGDVLGRIRVPRRSGTASH